MKNSAKQIGKVFKGLIIFAAVAAASWLGFLNSQTFIDIYKGSQFSPSSDVKVLQQNLVLTERGQRILLATHPELASGQSFNQKCQSTERTAAILGCYYLDKIYVYDVTNQELKDAKEVTLAHELLHAAYARLNFLDKPKVDAMIRRAYEKVKDDPTISDLMDYYRKAEPGAELDELHSILGTTISDLDDELEEYYAEYFTDRAAIVEKNKAYEAVFKRVNEEANVLQEKVDTAAQQIKAAVAVYQADLDRLNNDVTVFNQRARSGEFTSQADFNVARKALQDRVSELNARQTTLNQQISQYNKDVEELNKLAVKAQQLNESINGVAAPTGVNNG